MQIKNLSSLSDSHDTEETDSEGSWAVSYGDMVTLLLTFFILFFSIQPTEDVPKKNLLISLVDSLQPGNVGSANHPANAKSMSLALKPTSSEGVENAILQSWNGVAHNMKDHVIVEFPGISFFDSAQTTLNRQGAEQLDKFMKLYMPYAGHYTISVRSFTDTKKVRAHLHRFKDNLELSAMRSISVLRHLQMRGIPLDRIKIAGYGELKMTKQELEKIPGRRVPATESEKLSYSRTIALVIEPEEK